MRPSRVRRVYAALWCLAVLFFTASLCSANARADGVLSDQEAYVVKQAGHDLCAVLDRLGTDTGVAVVGVTIISKGVAVDSAADIISASVLAYCPSHWGELVAIGKERKV